MKKTIQGAARSRTVWLGMIAAVLGVIQANPQAIAPFVEPLVTINRRFHRSQAMVSCR